MITINVDEDWAEALNENGEVIASFYAETLNVGDGWHSYIAEGTDKVLHKFLMSVHTKEEYRRQGIMTMLMKEWMQNCIHFATSHKYNRLVVSLETGDGNYKAIGLYEKVGMKEEYPNWEESIVPSIFGRKYFVFRQRLKKTKKRR